MRSWGVETHQSAVQCGRERTLRPFCGRGGMRACPGRKPKGACGLLIEAFQLPDHQRGEAHEHPPYSPSRRYRSGSRYACVSNHGGNARTSPSSIDLRQHQSRHRERRKTDELSDGSKHYREERCSRLDEKQPNILSDAGCLSEHRLLVPEPMRFLSAAYVGIDILFFGTGMRNPAALSGP